MGREAASVIIRLAAQAPRRRCTLRYNVRPRRPILLALQVKFQSPPSIDHPLVRLRPICAADLEPWSRYLNIREVYQHTSWNHPTAQDLSSYLGNEMNNEPEARLRLAIADRENDQLLGTIGFHTVSDQNQSAEVAYDLHPSVWHKGVATAVASVVVAWAHAEAEVIRVQATVLESNASSIRVLERVGFSKEGLLRSYRVVRGMSGNFYMYAHIAPTRMNGRDDG